MLYTQERFIVPAQKGVAIFFCGRIPRFDPVFLKFLGDAGGTGTKGYNIDRPFQCEVARPSECESMLGWLQAVPRRDPHQICGLLYHLEQPSCQLLNITEGRSEINVVLGIAVIDDVEHLLFVEHEFENGDDEIHLHALPLHMYNLDDETVLLVNPKEEE